MRTLIQALPTKTDIEALIHKVEDAHHTEMHQVHTEIQVLTDRLTAGEATTNSLGEGVEAMERERGAYVETMADMQLRIEDLKGGSCLCNLRLRGISEALEQENFQEKLKGIFHKVLEGSVPADMDKVHRVLGSKIQTQRPRDIICCLHHFAHRETLLRRA